MTPIRCTCGRVIVDRHHNGRDTVILSKIVTAKGELSKSLRLFARCPDCRREVEVVLPRGAGAVVASPRQA
jgi:hypothetical protein